MIKHSFIIPVKKINDYIREAIPQILKISRDDFEIIIYPDQSTKEEWQKTRQIATGKAGPAMKRNLAIRDAQGEILIFLDDDAYPFSKDDDHNFLDILDQDFQDRDILAVGGPAITPAQDSFWQKVSGAVFLSRFAGGCVERYAPVGAKKLVDDWPSVNFAVRKNIFHKIKGFDEKYWPGEDTKFCLDLFKKTGKKILYDPELIVCHHRRENLIGHLKQVGSYGLHRGFFAKKFPENSCKLKYFMPSLFFLFVIFGFCLSFFSVLMLKLYLFGWLIYILALIKVFFDIRKYEKNTLVVLNALWYTFLTHLVYGMKFLWGLVAVKQLKSKLR